MKDLKRELVDRDMFAKEEMASVKADCVKVNVKNMQKNDVDSGIFILAFADTFLRGVAHNFDQADVTNHLRPHIAADLIRGGMSPICVSPIKKFFVPSAEVWTEGI